MRSKTKRTKLTLDTQTVRTLDLVQLQQVAGGATVGLCKYQISVGLCD